MPELDHYATPPQIADTNTYTGGLGHMFTVETDVVVTALERFFGPDVGLGNHIFKIWEEGSAVTPIASGTILAASPSDANGYKSVEITPVTLLEGVNYILQVDETFGGTDYWYAFHDVTFLSADFTIIGHAFGSSGAYPSNLAANGKGYGTPSFKYHYPVVGGGGGSIGASQNMIIGGGNGAI